MNHDITKIKALHFEHQIDLMWCDGNYEPMEKLLEMIDIPYNRNDLLDFGWLLSDSFIDNWGIDETIKRMKSFIPLDKENLNTDSSEGQTCLNKECTFWHSDREPSCYTIYSDCWADIHLYVCIAIKIGGLSALKELRDKWNVDTEVLYQYYDADQKGLYEKELYEMNLPIEDVVKIHLHKIKKDGDDKMSKPFFVALSEINAEEDITVYWDGNIIYVKDETGHQATTNTSLYQAYKFSVLINADFDYTATDKEVKELSEELLDLIDEDFYRINVWEYIDGISDDFKKLTGIQLGIDDKRGIVCGMTDDNAYDILCDFGSATYIAKLLWRYIKGDNRIKMQNGEPLFKGIDNPIANELADKYLMPDDYDLMAFAKALHKTTQTNWIVPTSFNDYLDKTYGLTCKCYWLGTSLLSADKEFNETFVVGRINWQNDWEQPIYCHIDSHLNNIWFEVNGVRSATLYDVMLPHLMISKDIKEFAIKLTEDNFIKICKKYDLDGKNINDSIFGYIHCSMYGTKGCLQKEM